MDNLVVLHNVPNSLDTAIGREFVADCVRAGEGVIADTDLCLKYEIEPETLATFSQDKRLIKAIRAEAERRQRTGIAAQELAAKIHAKAPTVLGDILNDKSASARHRIESAKELRATAAGNGSAESGAPNADKFIITINMGAGHIETYEKDLKPMKTVEAPANEAKINTDNSDWGWREK